MTTPWKRHHYRIKAETADLDDAPDSAILRSKIEPWLAALLQSEHLTLLVGSGLTNALAHAAGTSPADMNPPPLTGPYADKITTHAKKSANKLCRGAPNIEDTINTMNDLIAGLTILDDKEPDALRSTRDSLLNNFLNIILRTEHTITTSTNSQVRELLGSFLLTFASRTATRERLHVATTNYDRLIEYGCDEHGIHVIDRFTGTITPVFRSSRLDLDLHYNPPGIRGEPRYLEGVIKLNKLHGSIDWRHQDGRVRRVPLAYGATNTNDPPGSALIIYPNTVKDVETSHYPYADLFRDFATAICRPNSALVTYGYGFGDTHINHAIQDMLTIPSTHLLAITYDDCNGRLPDFLARAGHEEQTSLLVGPHFGDLATLTEYYLPKPAIDPIRVRETALLDRRAPHTKTTPPGDTDPDDSESA